MTAARSYKKPMAAEEARAELARCAGSQFDPAVVKAFLAISLSRVRWIAGPLSWLAQLPFLQSIPLAGQAVAAGTSVLVTGATVVGLGLSPSVAAAAASAPTTHSSRAQAGQHATATPGQTSTNRPGPTRTANGPPVAPTPRPRPAPPRARPGPPRPTSSTSGRRAAAPVDGQRLAAAARQSGSSSSDSGSTPPAAARRAPLDHPAAASQPGTCRQSRRVQGQEGLPGHDVRRPGQRQRPRRRLSADLQHVQRLSTGPCRSPPAR